MTPNSPFNATSPPSARFVADLLGRALAHGAEIDVGERHLRRPREVEEVGHHFAECLRLVADALDILAVLLRQRLEVEELAVALDRRETVSKLVRDAGRQLADHCEAFLQAELFFELLHRRQVGEEADRAVQLPVFIGQRRHRDAQVRQRQAGIEVLGQRDRPADDRHAGLEAFVDDVQQWLLVRRPAIVGGGERFGNVQHPAAGRIEDPELAVEADDEQPRGQARDDFAAEALRRVRARRGRPLLRFQPRDRFLERGRHQRVCMFDAAASFCVAGRGHEAQHGKSDHGDERGHDPGQEKQRVASWRHRYREGWASK